MNRDARSEGSADWKGDDWESARRRKFTLGLRATPSERLAWLEEVIRLAWAAGALPRRSAHPDDGAPRSPG
jgi:hypothetical protein